MAFNFNTLTRNAWRALSLPSSPPRSEHAPSVPSSTMRYRRPAEHVVAKLYNRIAIDVASATFKHILVDDMGEYVDDKHSRLGELMALRANLDQTWAQFVQDVVYTMFTWGSAAIVATDTTENPMSTESYEILSLRVGRVVDWYPRSVKVDLYDDREGNHKQVVLPKAHVAIVVNPLYEVINQPNSDLQRLLEKLAIIDAIDSESSSGKFNLLIQLPYVTSTDVQRKRAAQRQKDLEAQLRNSRYGVAYTERGESAIQLNRPLGNNLMEQVTWLTEQVYSALGMSEAVFNGKATEAQMRLYYTTAINPILAEITTAMTSAFISRNAYTRGERIQWFRDPFELVSLTAIGDLAQALTSAEVLTSNEVRGRIGRKQSKDARADQLVNANINNRADGRVSVARPDNTEEHQNDRSEPSG